MDTKLAPQPMGLRSVALALLTVTLWGGNPVAVQYCLDTLPPIAIAGVRFAIAAVFMWGWCVFSGEPILLRRKQWGPAFVTGVLLFAQISLFVFDAQWKYKQIASTYVDSLHFLINKSKQRCETLKHQ
ncbi:MAG: DMT family transporter, partial [Pirellulaceae bacterium]|nr:DMT family transporter [Pirellulaceae bacterium]